MNKILSEAFSLHQQGDLIAAKAKYQTVLQQNPQEFEGLVLLAMLLIQEKEYANALGYFLQAEKEVPTHPQIQVHLANTYKLLEKSELALQHYQKALTLKPDYAEAHHNLANLYAQLQNNQEAILHYEKAIALQPHYVAAYNHLALVYLKQNDVCLAKNHFKTVCNMEPHNVVACYHLGNFALEENALEEALRYYEQGLNDNVDYIPILTNLAATHLKLGNKDKAIMLYKHILQIDSDDAMTHMNLAAVYLLDKNDRLAIKHYSLVLQLDETNFNAHFNLGAIFMDKESYDMASSHFQTAVALLPENADAHYNYATCLLKQNLSQTALHHLRQAVKLAPNNSIFKFRLAAVSGEENPARPPADYIRTLFDRYAERFDKDLLQSLHYKAPELLCALLKEPLLHIAEATVVDIGCGTGLCGEGLKDFARHLIGIDLSPAMLSIARDKKIYQELIEGDIPEVLETRYFNADALIAADVWIYFGDLSHLLQRALAQVKASGFLAFSCEEGHQDDNVFHLAPTGRYQHGRTYIVNLLAATGWHLVSDSQVTLREQQGAPVVGRLYL
ncbi:MAG: tetratricopeptide repeat protein, partial [Gammaproteobacteria bacterium]|nr:tetratricopeptide repeat protein [Gammaproteobacteria bacterium]